MAIRGALWPLLAIAGSAAAAVLAYRYLTNRSRQRSSQSVTADSSSSVPEAAILQSTTSVPLAPTQQLMETRDIHSIHPQQLTLLQRQGSLLLIMFSLILMILVAAIGIVVIHTSEDFMRMIDLPMFSPLMWVAVGIFTAASLSFCNQTPAFQNYQMQVLDGKGAFPSDRSSNENASTTDSESDKGACMPSDSESDKGECMHSDSESEDLQDCILHCDSLFEQNQHKEIRDYLKRLQLPASQDLDALWRLARACNYLVDATQDVKEKKALAVEGLKYAEKAYTMYPGSAASNKWMAILTSTVGNFRPLQEKIAGAYVIRDHIQRAIELDPLDPTCHNILGQWCLAFADMTWFEKKAATALFGKPPTATHEEALQHFFSAENISPGFWKRNTYLIAETYMKLKQEKEAKEWLSRAERISIKTHEDEQVQKQIMERKLSLGE